MVPVGTRATDSDTGEVLGDLTRHGQKLKVAQGGFHGLEVMPALKAVRTVPHVKKPMVHQVKFATLS